MAEAQLRCPECDKPTRVVRYGSPKSEELTGETACGHTVDAMFVERCLSFEEGSLQEEARVHALHAAACPCGRCCTERDQETNS